MMDDDTPTDYPIAYIRDGLLVLTEGALTHLARAGLSREVLDRARRGMALAEGYSLNDIKAALIFLLKQIDNPNNAYC